MVETVLLFLIFQPIVYATKSECYNGLITIEVEAPNEVKPEVEFQIYFTIYSTFYNVYIINARAELWAMGNYKQETLFQGFSLKKGGQIQKNMTFSLTPAPPYPNIVICDIWLLCSQEEDPNNQFSHFRFTLSWCTNSTYEELQQVIQNQENDINMHRNMLQSFKITTTILAVMIACLVVTMVYFARIRCWKLKPMENKISKSLGLYISFKHFCQFFGYFNKNQNSNGKYQKINC
jgi:hypothetical protein